MTPLRNKFHFCDFTSFSRRISARLYLFPFPGMSLILKVCQTVVGISMTCQFHEFFKFEFLAGFCFLAQLCISQSCPDLSCPVAELAAQNSSTVLLYFAVHADIFTMQEGLDFQADTLARAAVREVQTIIFSKIIRQIEMG